MLARVANWMASAQGFLFAGLLMFASGLFDLFFNTDLPDRLFGALMLFMSGASIAEAAHRRRAARSAYN